jgi:hypothetical protein
LFKFRCYPRSCRPCRRPKERWFRKANSIRAIGTAIEALSAAIRTWRAMKQFNKLSIVIVSVLVVRVSSRM